jgi:hypothetical protein
MGNIGVVECLMFLGGLLLWEFGVVALYLGMGWDDV